VTGLYTETGVELRPADFVLNRGAREIVRYRFGPEKDSERAKQKIAEGKFLKDLNRVTLEFEDPLVMALMYRSLEMSTEWKILISKNKYAQRRFLQPPDLHINLLMGCGWIVEVQLILRDVLLIKKELHHYYQIDRSKDGNGLRDNPAFGEEELVGRVNVGRVNVI
jgi:hypothetical protein